MGHPISSLRYFQFIVFSAGISPDYQQTIPQMDKLTHKHLKNTHILSFFLMFVKSD